MSAVFADMKGFLNFTLPETEKRLKGCKTQREMDKLMIQFKDLVAKFNDDVKEAIEKAKLNFDFERKMIARSRVQGNHSSAWVLIADSGLYDPATVMVELDNWKVNVTEDIVKCFTEVNLQIKSIYKDYDHYKQDCDLVVTTRKKFKKLESTFKAEQVWIEKNFQMFDQSVQVYFQKSEKVDSLKNILETFAYLRNLLIESHRLTNFLEKDGKKGFRDYFSINPTMEDWKKWNDTVWDPTTYIIPAVTELSIPEPLEKISRSSFRNAAKMNRQKENEMARLVNAGSLDSSDSIFNPVADAWEAIPKIAEKTLIASVALWIELCRNSIVEAYEVLDG